MASYTVTIGGTTYTVEYFTATGAMSWTPPAGVTSYAALLVAGAGGGAKAANGGGAGGAGGLNWLTGQSCTPGTAITGSVGAGGAGATTATTAGTDGSNTVFGSTTVHGGGGGGVGSSGTTANNGRAGGSGGGGSGSTSSGNQSSGGAGTSGEGSNGGGGNGAGTSGQRAGGGGGGKGGTGGAGGIGTGGTGGAGYDASADLGTTLGASGWFAEGGGGGAGSTFTGGTTSHGGGAGGAGAGNGGNATANTGSGGGGSGQSGSGGNGAAGLIAIRYAIPGTTVTGGTATETDTGQAGTPVVGAIVGGGMATVTASVLAGTVLVGALVAGGQAVETDTGHAGAVRQGQIISGGTAVETDTAAAGTVTAGARVTGGVATETDTALAGATAQTLHGGTAVETDTAAAGTLRYVITGGTAVETDTALAGTVSAGGTLVAGGTAVETDTGEAGTVSLGYADTQVDNSIYALMFSGDAEVTWEPAVVPRPTTLTAGERVVAARAYVLGEVTDTGQALFDDITTVTKPGTRRRILIGHRDMTYPVDGVELQTPDYELLEPGGYGDGGTIVLPHIDGRFAKLGAGPLHRIKLGAVAKYQRVDVDTNEVVATDYVGFVLRQGRQTVSGNGGQYSALSLAIAGEMFGRAALRWRPVPIFRRIRDAGVQIYQVVVGAGLRMTPRLQHLGIKLAARGGMREDQWLTDTTAQLTQADGDQWTIMPTHDGGPYTLRLKDRETVHGTIYLDNSLASADLGDDLAEKPNRVWINAVAADGHRIMNASAPVLQAIDVPEFPTYLGGPMVEGITDADTSTKAGVTQLIWRLTFTGKLDKDDLPGGFDDDVADAVRQFQAEAGCADLTGAVTHETWDKLWDNLIVNYSTAYAAQRPAYEANAVQKFDRAGNGAILGHHDGFDPNAVVVDLPLDIGPVGTRRQAFKMAKGRLRQVGDTDWVGTITLTSGYIDGLHNPGDTLTVDRIRDGFDARPGMNFWVPYWDDPNLTGDGGTLFHVSAVKPSPTAGTVQLVVDTRARDAMEVWAVKQRNAENRYQPSRYLGGHRRRSTGVLDVVNPWDKIVGETDRDYTLTAGWTLIKVPAGQAGTVQDTSIELDRPAEFAAFFAQKAPPLGRLARKVHPLTEPDPDPVRHRTVISGAPTGGTFTLANDAGDETSALAHDATAGAVQAAVRGLGGDLADVTVTGSPGGPWTISLHGGTEDLNVGSNDLTGGHSPSISVTTSGGSVDGTPWYEVEWIRKWLKPYKVPIAWGTWQDPCGYDDENASRSKIKPNGDPSGAPVTGLFHDEDSWGYDLGLKGAELPLLIYVDADNVLPKQRILTIQLDGSGT